MSKDIDLNDVTHSRFDDEHIKICEDCYSDRLDFNYEQAREAELDALIEANEE